MPLRILTWLISLGIHAGFALAMLLPAGGAALQTGAREDTMVVEQGIAIEGFAKMGEDQVSLEEVEEFATQDRAADPFLDRKLRQFVAELPETQRIIVTLRYQEDLDPSEICRIVEMPVNTVKSHLHRALAALRRRLGEH